MSTGPVADPCTRTSPIDRQLELKSELLADAFLRIGKIELPTPVLVMPSEEEGYRMRARLHASNGLFGFFREGTHQLCEAEPTRQLLPATIAALRQLQSALKEAAVAGVMSCEIAENAGASERVVLIEMESAARAPLHIRPVEGVTGVLFADHHSARLTVAYGSPYVVDRVEVSGGAVTLTHHVQSFFQGNRYLLAPLVSRVIAQVPDGSVTDLYAGVGLFAVSLAARGVGRIVAVEGDRSSVRDLESNAAPHGIAIHVEHQSVEDYLTRRGLAMPETLVLDPPRTGISSKSMSGILGLKPPRVVYLSCDPATLARDARRFVEAGYTLTHIEAFDLFPNTAHVETLVVLSR